MDLSGTLTHLGAFVLGVATWLPFTVWEGRSIKHRGDHVNDTEATAKPERAHRSSLSRTQAIGAVILIVSFLVMAMGYQTYLFQQRFSDAADCYQDWGVEVTKTLDARSVANADLEKAQTKRSDSVDDVLLLFLDFRRANPPLTDAQRQQQFDKSLDAFYDAKTELTKAQAKASKIKTDNTYPKLDCGGQ